MPKAELPSNITDFQNAKIARERQVAIDEVDTYRLALDMWNRVGIFGVPYMLCHLPKENIKLDMV